MKSYIHIVLAVTSATWIALSVGCGGKSEPEPTSPIAGERNLPQHPALMEPIGGIYLDYFDVQMALAQDSLEGVATNAQAIAQAVKDDPMGFMPAEVAEQAEALAQAEDLKAAREALKPLSASLVDYLEANQVADVGIHQMYCPMAEASWLETDEQLNNPYMGKSMPECGEVKKSF